jgi:hypothetical protein
MTYVIVFLAGAWVGLFCLGLAISSMNDDLNKLLRRVRDLEDNPLIPQDGPQTGRSQGAMLAIRSQAAARLK